MATNLSDGETILFIGDSITDCQWREAAQSPLGTGYVRLVSDLILVREPMKRVRVINRGIGGNTVDDLRSRWHDDVLVHRPDWLSVAIGINDANRHVCCIMEPVPLPPEAFEDIYDQVLSLTRKTLPTCRLLLLGCFYASDDTTAGSYRSRLAAITPRYVKAISRLARRHQARYVDLHAMFHDRLRIQPTEVYFPFEPVHPSATGHLLIAEAVYQALS